MRHVLVISSQDLDPYAVVVEILDCCLSSPFNGIGEHDETCERQLGLVLGREFGLPGGEVLVGDP